MDKGGRDGIKRDDAPPRDAGVMPELTSDAEVRSIHPDGGRRVYRVAGARGLRLDIRPSGVRTWVVRYRTRAGRQRYHVLGQYPELSLAAARAAAREIRAKVDLGADPMAERFEARRIEEETRHRVPSATIEDIGRRCLAALDLRPSTRAGWGRLFEHDIVPHFGDREAASVRRAEIRAWGDKIARRAPIIANRAFEVLRRVYSWAVAQDLLEQTPFVALAKPSPERQSDRVLSREEIRVLWLACVQRGGAYEDAVRLLLLTGTRREMVLGMRASELEGLDGEEPRWSVSAARMKARRAHVVPLSPQAVAVIRRRLELQEHGYLFPPLREAKDAKVMTWSSRAMAGLRATMEQIRRAEALAPEPIARWRVHELRHTVATHMREDLGVPSSVVALILAHTPPGAAVTRVYDRSELLPERRDALVRWGAWVESLIIR